MTTEGALRRRSQLAQESRQKMLDAGIQIVSEHLLSPFEGVRAVEVAQRAGLTPGAFYHHWSSQDEYRSELREYLLGEHSPCKLVERMESIDELFPQGAARTMLQAGRDLVDVLLNEPQFRVSLSIIAGSNDEERDKISVRRARWLESFAACYAELFERFGLRLRRGMTFEWLTATVAALIEGFVIQRMLNDEPLHLGDGWTDLDGAVAALLSSVVVTDSHNDDNSLQEIYTSTLDRRAAPTGAATYN